MGVKSCESVACPALDLEPHVRHAEAQRLLLPQPERLNEWQACDRRRHLEKRSHQPGLLAGPALAPDLADLQLLHAEDLSLAFALKVRACLLDASTGADRRNEVVRGNDGVA